MSNFVYDNTSLAYPKTDLNPLPAGANETQWVQAIDWNTLNQAVVDIRGVLRSGKWYGLEAQASDPAPAGVTNYLWLNSSGVVTVKHGSNTIQLVPATRQIIAGSGLSGTGSLSANVTLSLETLSPSPAGTYSNPNITVDSHGRVTSISSGGGSGVSDWVFRGLAALSRLEFQIHQGKANVIISSGNPYSSIGGSISGAGPHNDILPDVNPGDVNTFGAPWFPLLFLGTVDGRLTGLVSVDSSADGWVSASDSGGSYGSGLCIVQNYSNNELTIGHEDTSSAAANRFDLGGSDVVMPPMSSALFLYNVSTSRWNLITPNY